MNNNEKSPQYRPGPVCAADSHIIYAWARDAPPFKLPEGLLKFLSLMTLILDLVYVDICVSLC